MEKVEINENTGSVKVAGSIIFFSRFPVGKEKGIGTESLENTICGMGGIELYSSA